MVSFSDVSVVVPAYNEERGLAELLPRLSRTIPGAEIIVVNDGSRDGTAEIASNAEAVRCVSHEENHGYGASLKTGIAQSSRPLIAIIDADGTYPVAELPALIEKLREEKLDMAVAARTGESVRIPLVRRPAKWVIGRLANLASPRHIPDINSGFRVFRRESALPFFALLPDGFSFTTTITLGMLNNGYRVEYLPVDYHARVGRSKIRPIHDTVNFVLLILRIALYFAPMKIFLPLSFLIFGAGAGWGLFSWLYLGKIADVSTLVISSAAVQVAAIGLLAELMNRRLPFHRSSISSHE